jgi:hypothetical protein
MSKTKMVVTVVSVMVVSGAFAALASANWMAGGKDVPSGTNLQISLVATVHEAPVLNVPSLKIKLSCTGLDVEEGFIIGGSSLDKAGSLKFLGCKVIEPVSSTCVLAEEVIKVSAVLSKATLFGTLAARILFSPEQGNLFAEVPFSEANTCALSGNEPVKGRVTVAAPLGQDELLLQPIEGLGETENHSLEIAAGNAAFIEKGKILLRLVNDSKWSIL